MKIIEQLANTCTHIPMAIMKKLLHTHTPIVTKTQEILVH
jgi:hypothetical protein